MTENTILLSNINDFIFCPVSIYFHNLMEDADRMMSQSTCQINGTHAHKTIEDGRYTSRKDVLQGIEVYCEKYDLMGKIDLFDIKKGLLTERKKKISQLYDGQVFQIYGQYFALKEMGYKVNKIRVHSMDDNKNYDISIPEYDVDMVDKFEETIRDMHAFNPGDYIQTNPCKCSNCIYEPMCGSSCLE
ncbi:MAG: type V CRISPR-associated protein Cas4 [Methanomassiliicoccaceae archaeon]|nr:type V CRISPR-associated protein Cas4 [Methanomassiliicoccaceae archaeon]